MSRARFFLTQEFDATGPAPLPLSEADLHHAARVLRVEPGEELDVVEPSGAVRRVQVVEVTADGVLARTVVALEQPWYPAVTLFQGVAKGEKMDAIVRQAVEVGAAQVVPVLTSRVVVRLDEGKRVQRGERWRRIAQAASKQARRDRVVDVSDLVEFSAALELLVAFDRVVVLWEDHQGALLSEVAAHALEDPTATVALVVGPEGGLSAEEVDALVARGAKLASLGPSIMRTETAAVVAVALVVSTALQLKASRER